MANDEERPDSQAAETKKTHGERARAAADMRAAERNARAAAKLRENLMRRKSQARARRSGEADSTQGLPAAKTDESS